MSRIVLLRHAHSSANAKGILSGRNEGVALSAKGAVQAQELIERLDKVAFTSIRISPMQRCQETINPWLNQQKVSLQKKAIIDPQLVEVDFGSWTGRKISDLAKKSEWKIVQNTPEKMAFPEGESLKQVQKRAMQTIALSAKGAKPTLIVTHADVIKAILSGLLSSGLKDFQKFAVNPASLTVIDYDEKGSRIITVNNSRSKLIDLLE
jgi:probable phosphomutase (TIGR03848 family)